MLFRGLGVQNCYVADLRADTENFLANHKKSGTIFFTLPGAQTTYYVSETVNSYFK